MTIPLRVVHLTRTIDPTGGCEIYIRNLAEMQKRMGLHVSVITALIPQSPTPLYKISFPDIASYKNDKAKWSVSKLAIYLNSLDPQIVHIHDLNNPHVLTYCAKNFPTIKTTLNADAYCGGIDKYLKTSQKACEYKMGYGCLAIAYYENCMKRNPKRAFEIISLKKKTLKASNSLAAHVVPSESSKRILIQNGVLEEKIRIVPLFTNFDSISHLTPYSPNRTILFAGRLRPYKGAHFLIEALVQIKTNYKAFIIGEGEEKEKLRKIVKNLKLEEKICFRGNLPHDEMKRHFADAAVVVVPSIYPDSFPTVGLEAMANARPVVGFRIGGIPEWLEDGKTGYLVEPQDSGALAAKIESLLLNPQVAENMGRAGFEACQRHYTEFAHQKLIEKLYEEVLSKTATSAL